MARKAGGRPKGRKQGGKRGGGGRGGMPVSAMPVGVIDIASGGFGFVETPEGRFFVPRDRTNGAMDGDTVRLRPRSSQWRSLATRAANAAGKAGRQAPIAVVDRVLERAHDTIVGLYAEFDGVGFVVPHDDRLDYLVRAQGGAGVTATEGDIVLVQMQVYPSRHEVPSGVVVRVIGREDDPRIAEEVIAARNGLQTRFSEEAIAEAQQARLDVAQALAEPDRIDVRDRFVLTIDPADARDFDDALSLEHIDGLVRLGVHIADVSHYVPWDSALDIEARKRATSTYFPDRVIPMLPERLSNGLCSLNPGEDRLAFTVDIYFDRSCQVQRVEMHPSVICSRLRLDYDRVQQMFDGTAPYPGDEAHQILLGLRKLAAGLRARRMKRGSLDFATAELKVAVDAQGTPVGLSQRVRSEATDVVEEAMIAANEAVAHYMLRARGDAAPASAQAAKGSRASKASGTSGTSGTSGAPMVFRVHDQPNASSIEQAVPALRALGYARDTVPVSGKQIQAVLDSAKGKPDEPIVTMLLLRSLKQAVYRDEFTTHFGLASDGYTHFTSPIRRYPDLLVHRLLRRQLFLEARERGVFPPQPDGTPIGRSQAAKMPMPQAIANIGPMISQLAALCEHCSRMERQAEKASYEALEVKVCEYMGRFVGREFQAIIVNVLAFGFFVRLADGHEGAGCEGLVPVRDLDGWFEYDDEKRVLFDADSARGRRFALGQRVRVVLASADMRKGRLTFRLA